MIFGILIIITILILFFYILFPWIMKAYIRRRFLSIIRNSGCICLTFDDGPCPESTPKILELLQEAGAKATFFLLGENVNKYPSLAAMIVASGHEVGEHSYAHSHPWKSGPFRSIVDLVKGGRAIRKYGLSNNSPMFRPPYGKLNLVTLLYIWLCRKQVAFWAIDPKDYREHSGERVVKSIIGCLCPGSVVLLHDGRRNSNKPPQVTVDALKQLLGMANDCKIFTTVSEAISRSSAKRNVRL
jgi:peptidoglycan/xylan/chitin deacetylase (PgdA/CDA1 family)